jgi:ABC-type polysaccharide/polyol phosphate export permease
MDPYPIFLFSGLLPWLFLSGALLDASITMVDNGALLAKVMCPPEIFPMVTVLSHLVHHLLALPVLLAALVVAAALGWHPFPLTIVFLPLALIPWVLTTTGLTLAVSAASVHFRDLRDLLGHILNLVFFSSPIIYALDGLEPWLRRILVLNPMASMVAVYRSAAFAGPLAEPRQWLIALALSCACCWLGIVVFSRLRESLVEAV